MLEVILKQDIYRLGDRGDVVKVADGYARNFLYPKRLAIPASKGSLKQLEEMKSAADREAVKLRGDAEKQAAALDGVVVRVVARAGQNNQLFGSVTNRDVVNALAEKGLEVDRQRLDMRKPFRTVDDYQVAIQLYKDITSTITVEVRAEGREDEPLVPIEEEPAEGAAEAGDGSEAVEGEEAAEGAEAAPEAQPEPEPEAEEPKAKPVEVSAVEAADQT